MKNYIFGVHLSPRFVIIFMLIAAFAGDCYAEQLKFGDGEYNEETDPVKDEKKQKKYVQGGINS